MFSPNATALSKVLKKRSKKKKKKKLALDCVLNLMLNSHICAMYQNCAKM